MRRIAIIGAGLSGRLAALNLIRHAPAGTEIRCIDRSAPGAMGPAYSDDSPHLLLNVPACRMGALSADPEHFLRWALERGVDAGPWDFLPRRLYREYVLDLLARALAERMDGPRVDQLRGEAADVEIGGDGAAVHVTGLPPVVADRVVLALGNHPPRDPPVADPAVLRGDRYVRNPWRPGVLDGLARDDTVFMIGTGQTTVDVAVTLHARGHEGRVVALSRRGLLPLPHRGFQDYPSFFDEIGTDPKLRSVFRAVRRHVERAGGSGVDPRAVIDSLRPDTQALWLGFPEAEKARFLRHAFRYWEVIRSRIPQESQAVVDAMRASGQLDVVAGRIRDMADAGAALEVRYSPRERAATAVERAALVLNCIGPESDIRRIDDRLIRNLLRRGAIRPGPAGLGIDALPDGAVLARDGSPSTILYTLGPIMKGVLWEVLAAPEIRVQAERLARLLLLAGDPAGAGGPPARGS